LILPGIGYPPLFLFSSGVFGSGFTICFLEAEDLLLKSLGFKLSSLPPVSYLVGLPITDLFY